MSDNAKLPAPIAFATPIGTRAQADDELIASWVSNLNSAHIRCNFELTARRFLAGAHGLTLHRATVEDVRDAINAIAAGQTLASARQTMLGPVIGGRRSRSSTPTWRVAPQC